MERGVDYSPAIPLTPREREVAELVAAGLTNAEIAERLNLTFATAKWHVSQVLAKLEVDHREAVGPRLAETSRQSPGHPRWQFAFGPLISMKALGTAAAVFPVVGVAVFSAAVLWSGRAESPVVSVAETPEPSPTIAARPIDEVNRALIGDGPECILTGRDLGAIWGHNFTFAGCDLRDARLIGAGLNDADFSGADLEGADLSQATVGGANFTGANLRNVVIRDAIAQGADFTNANLTGADFLNTIVAGAIWDGAICPDGRPSAERGTCIGSPGLENPPTTRSYDVLDSLVGREGPDFRLIDTRGDGLHHLGPHRGKVVVLTWYSHTCQSCEATLRAAEEAASVLEVDVVFIAINAGDDEATANAYLDEIGATVVLSALDRSRSVANAYGVVGFPATVVIDREGIVRAYSSGPFGMNQVPALQLATLLDAAGVTYEP